MNFAALLRVAGKMSKCARVLEVISRVLCVLSLAALAGGIAIFCRQLAGKKA